MQAPKGAKTTFRACYKLVVRQLAELGIDYLKLPRQDLIEAAKETQRLLNA